MPPAATDADATTAELQAAVAVGDDASATVCLRRLAAAAGAPPSLLRGVTFEGLAAAGLATAAVGLARWEAGGEGLAEAEATADGGSYLHAAAAAGAPAAVVSTLVAAGCALERHDGSGATALHVAAAAGRLATCTALLDAGADPLARNGAGRTPRSQGRVPADVAAVLAEAEGEARRRREAAFQQKLQATQTQSAVRLGCV